MSSTRHNRHRARLSVELLENRCLLSAGLRTIDGTDNNAAYPDWGAANTQLLRDFTVAYGDGISSPAGADSPSARAVSNAVLVQTESLPSQRRLSAMVFQWGQFLDHDMDLTDNAVPAEPFPIQVPVGDPHFDPLSLGGQVISLNRSAYDPTTGIDTPRQQINAITAFLDASNVYGSDPVRAAALRTGVGGRLKVTPHDTGDLLPFNTEGLPNAGGTSPSLFLAGDVRANEQVGLTALHTLFVREHNRLADDIAAANPTWTDEQIYQRARKFVGAQIQVITYNEFLPAVLGPNRLSRYQGYNPQVNPGISNLFSTAAFRVGHTMLTAQLLRLDDNGNVIPAGNLALRDAFFGPDRIVNEGGIDPLLKGLTEQVQQEVDARIIDDVRNFLFGPPGAGGFDLASLNIQRGRDHGLPMYNQAREDMGLAPAMSFADVSSDVRVQTALASVYANVNEVDVWVGGIAEDHLPGSSLGELFTAIWVDQFTRLRDGDRFWYENDPAFSKSELAQLNHTTLADVILRNTEISKLHANVFFQHSHEASHSAAHSLAAARNAESPEQIVIAMTTLSRESTPAADSMVFVILDRTVQTQATTHTPLSDSGQNSAPAASRPEVQVAVEPQAAESNIRLASHPIGALFSGSEASFALALPRWTIEPTE